MSNMDVGSLRLDSIIPDFVHMSGDVDVGDVGLSSNLSVKGTVYLGTNKNEDGTIALGYDNVISGGINNFVMGHENIFFGKESASIGNEGNKVGAKAFYWNAIDTTNHKIYLTTHLPTYKRAPNEDLDGKIDGVTRFNGSSNYSSKDEFRKYDSPYFGPVDPNDEDTYRQISSLLSIDNGINLRGVSKNTPITIYNTDYSKYIRCYKVISVDGSVITYQGNSTNAPALSDEVTRFKKNFQKEYNDNYYTLYFPDMVQSKISCDDGAYVVHQSFGNLAVGDSNTTMGNNSIAMGKDNRATGNYSVAIGYGNKAQGLRSIAIGMEAVCNGTDEFAWKGKKFVINTDINNIYIGNQTLKQALGLE